MLTMISTAIQSSTSTRLTNNSEAMESRTKLTVTNTMITCVKQCGLNMDKATNRKTKLLQESKTYSIHLANVIHNILSMNNPRHTRNRQLVKLNLAAIHQIMQTISLKRHIHITLAAATAD